MRLASIAIVAAAFATAAATAVPAAELRDKAPAADLKSQLGAFAAANRIEIEGAQHVLAPPRNISGSVDTQLQQMLDGYNYVVRRDANGTITAVIISGERPDSPAPSPEVTIQTARQGNAHFVDAVIIGERPVRLKVRLMLDTGASQIVLPVSMLQELGYGDRGHADLHPAILQTANGPVSGYVATLKVVEVGAATEHDVPVAFIDDELLGGNKLLGMSFLSRYVITLDDETGTLGLMRRTR